MNDNLRLEKTDEGLILTDGTNSMLADLTTMIPRLKQQNLEHEMLIKAARIKGWLTSDLRLLDATAGMGEDSLLLAAAGFTVDLYEYDHVIAELLRDALLRAHDVPELADIVSRMTLHEEDSISAMRCMADKPGEIDVVLLDPMFPARQKSAMVKKKFQLLQQLESPCSDENDLLEAAIALKPRKIVIKRPVKGPYLANRKPDYSLSGKAIRYDCIVMAR